MGFDSQEPGSVTWIGDRSATLGRLMSRECIRLPQMNANRSVRLVLLPVIIIHCERSPIMLALVSVTLLSTNNITNNITNHFGSPTCLSLATIRF